MTIELLSHDVAAKIAAGEVVERPANVVKELIENSLDAGATEIRVEIREGGQRLLRVSDNGCGIAADEVTLAFQRHATSKLQSAEDLNHIATFGFRGEALYSIAAVSRLTMTTRTPAAEALAGVQVRLEGGELRNQQAAGTPVGTVVNVEHLFFNMPARRKFLRKPATEAGRISSVVQRQALAHPDRRFSFVNEGRLLFQSTGSGDLLDVLVKIYGLENAKQMVPVGQQSAPGAPGDAEAEMPGLADEIDFMDAAADPAPRPPIVVHGYTSLPSLTRANRNYIDIFVNQRHVDDRNLTYAVTQAYHTLLPGGRFPIATIFVEIDPELVDVNVHPQKTQVRFHEERRVFSAVQKAVRSALITHAPVPDMALPPGAGPQRPSRGTEVGNWSAVHSAAPPRPASNQQEALDIFTPPAPASEPTEHVSAHPPPEATVAASTEAAPPASARRTAQVEPQRKLPPLRVVGQVGAMYIITEGPEGLYLIDQHAAHERILYEQFMAERYGATQNENTGATAAAQGRERGIARQQLLEPLTLHAGSAVAGLVADHLDELQRVGFAVEPFGGDTFLVRAVPALLSDQDPLRVLEEIATTLGTGRNRMDDELEARLVKMICKRAAIKAGQQLSEIEMRELVRQLEACQSPRTCPHGRPTMIQLSANELEKAFGRI
jgi:DNA mismatch repair protein MutL